MLTLSRKHEVRLLNAKRHEFEDYLSAANLHTYSVPANEEAITENLVLRTSRELRSEGVHQEKHHIRSIAFYFDGVKIEDKSPICGSNLLGKLNILQRILKIVEKFKRIVKFANANINSEVCEICSC